MHQHDHEHHHGPWQSNWKSPVALGLFLLTAALAGAIVLYTLLNIGVSLFGILHAPEEPQFFQQGIPAQGMTAPASGATDSMGQ